MTTDIEKLSKETFLEIINILSEKGKELNDSQYMDFFNGVIGVITSKFIYHLHENDIIHYPQFITKFTETLTFAVENLIKELE